MHEWRQILQPALTCIVDDFVGQLSGILGCQVKAIFAYMQMGNTLRQDINMSLEHCI